MDRVILHCDCNGFYAAVEAALRPELREVPMAVCGDPESRHGVILAKNELAKAYGVQTAETIWQARKKCPDLVLVPAHHDAYEAVSHQVGTIYQRYTDQVEPFGIDESWLDVTGSQNLFGDGPTIANTLRRVVREELGVTISVGVSFNKIFAKMGSDYRKPDATTVITRSNFRSLLYPLPVGNLLYVGRATQEKLRGIYVETIGQLAACDRGLLHSRLGKLGEQLHDYANGLENSPVAPAHSQREVKSVGNGMTFRRDLVTLGDIRIGVMALADTVAARLRRYGLQCHTVAVQIRDPNFRTISRQRTLEAPTALARELGQVAMEILASSWRIGQPIRMITITGCSLVPAQGAGEQLSLFESSQERLRRQEQLELAMDRVRERYGRDALCFGAILHNDLGLGGSEEREGAQRPEPLPE